MEGSFAAGNGSIAQDFENPFIHRCPQSALVICWLAVPAKRLLYTGLLVTCSSRAEDQRFFPVATDAGLRDFSLFLMGSK